MIDRLEFQCFGQEVRCKRAEGGRDAAAFESVPWPVTVDGMDRGRFETSVAEKGEALELRARWYLFESNAVRVPTVPWQWSILDHTGKEWWARLVYAAGSPRELRFLSRTTAVELSREWPDREEPTPNVLRAILSDAQESMD